MKLRNWDLSKLRFFRKSWIGNSKNLSKRCLLALLALSFCFLSIHLQLKIGYRATWTTGLSHCGYSCDWYSESWKAAHLASRLDWRRSRSPSRLVKASLPLNICYNSLVTATVKIYVVSWLYAIWICILMLFQLKTLLTPKDLLLLKLKEKQHWRNFPLYICHEAKGERQILGRNSILKKSEKNRVEKKKKISYNVGGKCRSLSSLIWNTM